MQTRTARVIVYPRTGTLSLRLHRGRVRRPGHRRRHAPPNKGSQQTDGDDPALHSNFAMPESLRNATKNL
jgi:hypothetical protein